MKNLLSYINPSKSFDEQYMRLVKIQIDNSLYYWKPEDIFLVTNFPFEYHGIKAIEVPDSMNCEWDNRTSKVPVIIYLLENKILTEDAWFHDFDCFQNHPFKVNLKQDIGLTNYGWKEKWNTGSFFFKPSALDIFHWLWDFSSQKKANEEPILWELYRDNYQNIRSRCQKINLTYNLGKRYPDVTLPMAEKPIKVVHFHPYWRPDRLERFKKMFLSDNLIKLLDEHNPRKRRR